MEVMRVGPEAGMGRRSNFYVLRPLRPSFLSLLVVAVATLDIVSLKS